MAEEKEAEGRTSLEEQAEKLGVLICEVPIAHGPNKGESARGTRTGYTRHRNAGHRGDEIDADCRDYHNTYVRDWLRRKRAEDQDRVVHAVLSDGAEVVRYQTAKQWKLERDGSGQKITLSEAAEAIKNDPDVDYRRGLPGGAALEKHLPHRLVSA